MTMRSSEVRIDEFGLVLSASAGAHELLGAENDAALIGSPLVHWFDEEGRQWWAAAGWFGSQGVEERNVVTRLGRPLRVLPVAIDRFLLIDATRFTALNREMESESTERAVLELVPSLRRDLNEPMSMVLGRLEILLELCEPSDASHHHLRVAVEHARRASTVLHLMRMVERPQPACIPQCDLRVAWEQAVAVSGVTSALHVDEVPDVAVAADAELLTRGIAALLVRLEAEAGQGAALSVAIEGGVSRVTLDFGGPGHFADLSLVDEGGLPVELGVIHVALCRAGVLLERRSVGGARGYRMTLGVARAADDVVDSERNEIWMVGIADPGQILARALDRWGCSVREIADAERAAQLLETQRPYGLVTALSLPGRSGVTLLDLLARRYPEILRHSAMIARAPAEGLRVPVPIFSPPLDIEALVRTLGCSRI